MNNAQLIKTLAKKRTANFREDETRLLISLWGSPQIQNKLNLTHRKAPVMRLIAANMQQRGFYRSPDEIKTRIRNLKCLYHRIKRTITSGSGIGTVDPDWPHFKAMDAILGDSNNSKNQNSQSNIKTDLDMGEHFEIKQEIDINDDLESWNGNESVGSEFDDEITPASLPEPAITITTTPIKTHNTTNSHSNNNNNTSSNMGQTAKQTVLNHQPTRTITCTPQIRPAGQTQNLTLPPSIPLPFLILNNLKPAQTANANQQSMNADGGPPPNKRKKDSMDENGIVNNLSQLLEIQKQLLDVDKQRLEIEKQRLEFDRLVGSQLMTLVPMMGSLIQRLIFSQTDVLNKSFDMGLPPDDHPVDIEMRVDSEQDEPPLTIPISDVNDTGEDELEKNRNILRNLLNEGLKARMMEEQNRRNAAEETNVNEETQNPAEDNETENNEREQSAENDKTNEESERENADETNDNENENDDNESCVLLINENSVGTNEENN